MGEDVAGLDVVAAAERAIDAVGRLIFDIGLAKGLSQLGLREEFIPILSLNATRDACLLTNPRSATREQIEEIFRSAM
jgi:1,3-propanediol dehydrogenase